MHYLKKGKYLLLVLSLTLFASYASAQTKVTGTVVDETGESVIGASIKVKGAQIGTVTDFDGNFTLTVPEGSKTLVVSYVGMETQEVAIKPTMKITLINDAQTITEVVVTGMQVIDKRLSTGATDRIDAEKAKLDGIADVSRALEGRSAGVSVQNVSGTFGTAPKIRVRGATSIYGNSKPLWVVDGIIMEDIKDVDADALSSGDAATLIASALGGISADDIESFQILKDGSATSIYGARAMAGVIVITTKKGIKGASRVSYTGEFTSRAIPSYNDFNIMNSQEQMGIYKELEQKGWINFIGAYRASDSGVYGKMYQMLNTRDPKTGQFLLENTEAARNAYLKQAEYRNTDWFKQLFSTDIMQNHSVSISSGSDKSQFYASLSGMFDPGWYKESDVSRYTVNLNGSYDILENLTLDMIANGAYREQHAPGTMNQATNVVFGTVSRDFDINPYSYALNTSRAMDPKENYTLNYAPFNILDELENNNILLNTVGIKFQGGLKWTPIKGLTFAGLAAYIYNSSSIEQRVKDASNQANAYRAMGDATIIDNNPLLYTDPDNRESHPTTLLPEGGIYQRTEDRMNATTFRGTVNFNKTFDDVHIVSVFGGSEVNSVDRQSTWFNGWGMQYDGGYVPYYIYQYFKKSIESNVPYYALQNQRIRMAAFFINPAYSYMGRYSFNGTLRYEGSNQLGKARNARWLPTWNISGAWSAHEEEWFEDVVPFMSTFKIRPSYSLTAVSPPVSNATVRIVASTVYRPFTEYTETASEIYEYGNEELTYEKKHEFNFGIDAGFLRNRFNISFDIFRRNNFDLIAPINTAGVGGSTLKYANVGNMTGEGFEFTVSTKNIDNKTFKWSTDLTFGYNTTKVTDFKVDCNVMQLVAGSGFTMEGYPVRSLFSFNFKGLDEYGTPMIEHADGKVTSATNVDASDFDFQARDGLDYLVYEGSTEPTTTGGLGNIFTYNGFKLNVFITYSFGNVVRLDPTFAYGYSDLRSMPKEFKNRWVLPGDENVTNIPAILTLQQYYDNTNLRRTYNAYNYSTARVASGDFIRMKEISLTYDFPKKLIGEKIKNLSLKIQATNLFLIYADKKLNGQDPEFMNSGGVASPVPRQFTATLRMSL
jgi:TonB-linked SusC/RagA family outer membrane protein